MVKIFQFPLQKVLDLKEMIEETNVVKLKNSKAILKKEQKKLEKLEKRKDYLLDFNAGKNVEWKNLDLNNLKVSMDYISQLNDMISSQAINVKESNKSVDENRNNLLEASKDAKVMEKLRERHFEIYKKNHRKKDIKIENEIAIRMSTHNKMQGDNQ